MARQGSVWKSIAVGFEALALLFASLIIGGGSGWLLGHLIPHLRFWFLLAGLAAGLILAIWQILKRLATEDQSDA